MDLVLDIETDSRHKIIWLCCTHNSETGEVLTHTTPTTLLPLLSRATRIIGHNIISFDAPLLNKLWGTRIGLKKVRDTLVMSRLLNPSLEGGHSLDAWGKRLGDYKVEYKRLWHWMRNLPYDPQSKAPYDDPQEALNSFYCRQDVAITTQLFKLLERELKGWGESVQLEHDVAAIVTQQERHGFKFNTKGGQVLLATLSGELADIEGELQLVFPPIVEQRVSEKTGKPLKEKVTAFNPGSRQQIATRLTSLGASFVEMTDKGSVVVNEKTLEGIHLPEARLIARYLMLQKRISQISSWVDVVKEDGRVHGRVITNGAVTGRMTHMSPNMAQVPNAGSAYGPECRALWGVDEGFKLVGIDASGLELRMLAHYMKDDGYINEILNGDVHTANQKAAGLDDRNTAKTFIYAFLYGAGAAKIGEIVGGSEQEGRKLMRRFLRNTPALARLKDDVAADAAKGWIEGLDGRHLIVRSQHSALNTLLQGAGAILMKKALVLLHEKFKRGIINAKWCANVHDEWQVETDDAERVSVMGVQAIEEAGGLLGLRCPTTGEAKVGFTWRDTH